MTPLPAPLASRVLHAAGWNYAGTAARVLLQLITMVALARIVGPVAFGQFAITILVVGVASIVVDMGMGNALIQKKELPGSLVRGAFLFLLVTGTLGSATIWISAPIIADWFKDPHGQLVSILRGSTVVVLLTAFTVVPISLLKRELRMKEVQLAYLLSYVCGFTGVGLGCAFAGFGATSLVLALIAHAAINGTVCWILGWPRVEIGRGSEVAPLLKYASRTLTNNVANWSTENLDNLLIGKLFGSMTLGLYSVSYNLVRTPTNHLVVALQSVLFSAASRRQGSQGVLRDMYLAVGGLVALIALPVFVTVACVADTVVLGLYGPQWGEATVLLLPLALAMPFHALTAVAGPVLSGMGQIGREVKVQVGTAVLLVIAVIWSSRISVGAVAWAVLGVYAFRTIWLTSQTALALGLSATRLVRSLWPALTLAAVVGGTVLGVDLLVEGSTKLGHGVRLAIDIGLAGTTTLLVLAGTQGRLVPRDARWLVQDIATRLPWRLSWVATLIVPAQGTIQERRWE